MSNTLPNDMQTLRTPLPGESSGQHIARCIKAFVGVSLSDNRPLLNELFLTNESSPSQAAQIATVQTNCGTFMRAIWCLAGCTDHFVTQPYETGMAVTWDLEAAQDLGTLVDCRSNPNAWQEIDEGWGLHYGTPGQNNDHMEFALGKPDANGVCTHAGGGRANNAVTMGTDNIRFSLGRPLLAVIRPDKMGTAGDPIVIPPPDPTPDPEPAPVIAPDPDPTVTPVAVVATNNAITLSPNVIMMIIQYIMALIAKLFGKK